MRIKVRDDDIFRFGGRYTSYRQVVERVKKIHKIIVSEGAIHIVGLLCGTLNWFPGGLDFLIEAYNKGELIPEIHGWDHIDYGNLPKEEVVEHLECCMEVIWKNFGCWPTKFYTPWGGNDLKLKEAAASVKLKIVDCSNILSPKRKFFGGKMWESYSQAVREDRQELFIHWYEDQWFKPSETHSLIKTLRTIKNNDPSFWNK